MSERIADFGEEGLKGIRLPIFDKGTALQIVDIVCRPTLLAIGELLFVRNDFDGALKGFRGIERGIATNRVAQVDRLLHIAVNILPLRIAHKSPERRLNLLRYNFVGLHLYEAVMVVQVAFSLPKPGIKLINGCLPHPIDAFVRGLYVVCPVTRCQSASFSSAAKSLEFLGLRYVLRQFQVGLGDLPLAQSEANLDQAKALLDETIGGR